MQRLLDGYRRYRNSTAWSQQSSIFRDLAATGQSPKYMVVACCDSRVQPDVLFDVDPGEMFVVRNVANLVPPYAPDSDNHGTSAALEFAVRVLKVEHIVIMGHSLCGGIDALLRDPEGGRTDFIGPWMAIAATARMRALAEKPHSHAEARSLCEHESIRVSLENLMTFPWVRERVEAGLLQLHGLLFDVETGDLEALA